MGASRKRMVDKRRRAYLSMMIQLFQTTPAKYDYIVRSEAIKLMSEYVPVSHVEDIKSRIQKRITDVITVRIAARK